VGIGAAGVSILEVEGLSVTFPSGDGGRVAAVDNVSFQVGAGESLGLVGESGSGKTMIGLSILGLVPSPGEFHAQHIKLNGEDLSRINVNGLRRLRGKAMGMIFQDPNTSLNPVRTVGELLNEAIRRHSSGMSREEARGRAVEALTQAGVPGAADRYGAYPHQLSGGLRQRVMVALATVNDPALLIADEPTTALDTTIQAQLLELLKGRLAGRAMIMITHDLGVAAEICDRILVLQRGRIVESGPVNDILVNPKDPYTRTLLDAVPAFDKPYKPVLGLPKSPVGTKPLLQARDVTKIFSTPRGPLAAVRNVDLTLRKGEIVGLVGESGSGKSTLAKLLLRIYEPTSGQILFDGEDVAHRSEADLRVVRQRLQLVMQDPYASLDPRWSAERILSEPLVAMGRQGPGERAKRIAALIEQVGLEEDMLDRPPAQFSGGQRQRLAIARALALEPEVIVADEPVSALDVSVQAQIVRLLKSVQSELGVAYLIIAHDLPLIGHVADRVVVMYLGSVVEDGPTSTLISAPRHPYTRALLQAAPSPDPTAVRDPIVLKGEPPSPLNIPSGCPFHPRCFKAQARCETDVPMLEGNEQGKVACFYPN
jgi:peptide/nickel transport system ATP-binding protein